MKRSRFWTEEEERRLLEMEAAGKSTGSMSKTFERSMEAVLSRLRLLRARAHSGAEGGAPQRDA